MKLFRLCAIIALVAVLCAVTASLLPGKAAEPDDGYLDVRHSVMVIFAFGDKIDGHRCLGFNPTNPVVFPFRRLNPGSQKYARFFLEQDTLDEQDQMKRGGALRLLAFIGDDSSVAFVDDYIQKWLQSPVYNQPLTNRNLALSLGAFAGAALSRDLKGARAFTERYAQLDSWIVAEQEEHPTRMELEYAERNCSNFVTKAFFYSQDEFLRPYWSQTRPSNNKPLVDERQVAAMEALPYCYYTELMKPRPAPTGKWEGYFEARFQERVDKIDALIARADGKPVPEPPSVPEEHKVVIGPKESPSEPPQGIHEPPVILEGDMAASLDIEALCEEGVAAYEQFVGLLLAEEYDTLLKSILNNERPVYPEKVQRNRDKLVKALRIEQALLAEAQRGGLLDKSRYRNFQVSLSLAANLDRITSEEQVTQAPKGTETVTLLFIIPGSADVYEKHIPQVGGGSAEKTITPEGDLQVFMKKNNGKWCWNPFGW